MGEDFDFVPVPGGGQRPKNVTPRKTKRQFQAGHPGDRKTLAGPAAAVLYGTQTELNANSAARLQGRARVRFEDSSGQVQIKTVPLCADLTRAKTFEDAERVAKVESPLYICIYMH